MILSDRTLREELASGRIVIDPLNEANIQPSSIDLTLDRYFRVFLNHSYRVIDVKEDQEDLTELVEIKEDDAFILHPGEFVLGSTAERVSVPDDLVARLEGKSSLGRLGLLIHSSLPASETVLFCDESGLRRVAIGDLVAKKLNGLVVSFDPATFDVGFAEVTGWYEGPADRIFEVELASGRTVRVTAGHNLFGLDPAGKIAKIRTGELRPGTRVAIPRVVPTPVATDTELRVAELVPEARLDRVVVAGPTVHRWIRQNLADAAALLRASGVAAPGFLLGEERVPLAVARQVPGLVERLTGEDRVDVHRGRNDVPAVISVGPELAWLLGLFVADGYRRATRFAVCNSDQAILDRASRVLESLGLAYDRHDRRVVCSSAVGSELLGWLGTGGKAPEKRVPAAVFGWPEDLIEAFLEGVADGDESTDGSAGGSRTSVWTTSAGLVGDLLLLFQRLGRQAGSCPRPERGNAAPSWQVSAPGNDHESLVDGDICWDEVVAVRDTASVEPIYDIEVRPSGRKIENFVAGSGVFVSNTAGFVDAGFEGHVTLELSNVANLPITLYPGMKIGQISFLRMTTPADKPYGSQGMGSKYQGQRGPTPSRYWENFQE